MENDGRKLDIGDILSANGLEFEVITISVQEQEGKLVNFRYELALKSEIDAWRETQKPVPEEVAEPEQPEVVATSDLTTELDGLA